MGQTFPRAKKARGRSASLATPKREKNREEEKRKNENPKKKGNEGPKVNQFQLSHRRSVGEPRSRGMEGRRTSDSLGLIWKQKKKSIFSRRLFQKATKRRHEEGIEERSRKGSWWAWGTDLVSVHFVGEARTLQREEDCGRKAVDSRKTRLIPTGFANVLGGRDVKRGGASRITPA